MTSSPVKQLQAGNVNFQKTKHKCKFPTAPLPLLFSEPIQIKRHKKTVVKVEKKIVKTFSGYHAPVSNKNNLSFPNAFSTSSSSTVEKKDHLKERQIAASHTLKENAVQKQQAAKSIGTYVVDAPNLEKNDPNNGATEKNDKVIVAKQKVMISKHKAGEKHKLVDAVKTKPKKIKKLKVDPSHSSSVESSGQNHSRPNLEKTQPIPDSPVSQDVFVRDHEMPTKRQRIDSHHSEAGDNVFDNIMNLNEMVHGNDQPGTNDIASSECWLPDNNEPSNLSVEQTCHSIKAECLSGFLSQSPKHVETEKFSTLPSSTPDVHYSVEETLKEDVANREKYLLVDEENVLRLVEPLHQSTKSLSCDKSSSCNGTVPNGDKSPKVCFNTLSSNQDTSIGQINYNETDSSKHQSSKHKSKELHKHKKHKRDKHKLHRHDSGSLVHQKHKDKNRIDESICSYSQAEVPQITKEALVKLEMNIKEENVLVNLCNINQDEIKHSPEVLSTPGQYSCENIHSYEKPVHIGIPSCHFSQALASDVEIVDEFPFSMPKFREFVHVESDPNGEASVLHVYQDEINVLSKTELDLFAQDFCSLCFHEKTKSVPDFVMGIVHGAARKMPDFLEYLSEKHSDVRVKSEVLGQRDIVTMSVKEFRDQVCKTFSVESGMYR